MVISDALIWPNSVTQSPQIRLKKKHTVVLNSYLRLTSWISLLNTRNTYRTSVDVFRSVCTSALVRENKFFLRICKLTFLMNNKKFAH